MSYNEQLRCDYLTTNHEGAKSWRMTPEWELYTTVVTMMGVEDKFYEKGNDRVNRVADLVRKADPEFTARLAVYAREEMHLRSVPLLLLVELARYRQRDSLVSRAISRTVQRADELSELLMCYQWRSGRKSLKHLSHQLRKGLAESFNHFDAYQFAKYDRKDRKVTLRDALLLVHPKPKDKAQTNIFRKILNDTLEMPYTWETELSSIGQRYSDSNDEKSEAKREAWHHLIRSRRMGYMATLRNLRNMLKLHLDDESIQMVCDYLSNPEAVRNSKQLPFRFLAAYIQLIGTDSISIYARNPLVYVLEKIKAKCQKIQGIVDEGRNGNFLARVRKVNRFYPGSAYCIANRVTLPCSLDYHQRKMHSSFRVWGRKHSEHPSEKNLLRLSKLEKLLNKLRKQEKKLDEIVNRSYETRVIKKYGENSIKVLQTLEAAVCHTAMNISGFDEDTRVLIASDTSGSMYQPISQKSSVMCYHIGLMLSMLMRYRCKSVVTGMFGDFWKTYEMPEGNILRNTVEMIAHEGEVGYATNGHKVIDWLIRERRVMDKVMLFTDCQLWNSEWGDEDLAKSWDAYKKIAPKANLYIFDLAGYGQSPISMKREDVFCLAGWSDKVFDILAALERGNNAIDEIRRIVI